MSTANIGLSIRPNPNVDDLVKTITRTGLPARVPFMELFADWEVMVECCRLTGLDVHSLPDETRHLEVTRHFYYTFGYDYVPCTVGNFGFPRDVHLADDTAPELKREKRSWTDEHRGPITSWQEFETYPWPDPSKVDTSALEWYEKNLPDGMGIASGCHSIFEQVTWLMGYESLCLALYDAPDLVDAMFERIGSLFYEVARVLVQFPRVRILMGGDDMGFKTQPMVPPQVLIEKSFPWHRKITQLAHQYGKPNVLHSCGNLTGLWDAIIDYCGYDGKHSFEDVIEPVWEAKKRIGDRISLIGGVDVDFLCRASEDQVRQRVRFILEQCMPGGGYCLGTGNTACNYIPVRNYLAMLDEGYKCGWYT